MVKIGAVSIKSIGETALKILKKTKKGRVLGVTSKGIFLQTSAGQVIFLSFETWRGPLTANLPKSILRSSLPSIGDAVQIDLPEIRIGTSRIVLSEEMEIWSLPDIPINLENQQAIQERSAQLCKLLSSEESASPFLPLLLIASADESTPTELAPRIRKWLEANMPKASGNHWGLLTPWIGYGGGLTPSGDDFICGYLLAEYYLSSSQEVQQKEIIKIAREQTTALSATLISTASQGAADERLMMALSFLAQGEAGASQIKEALLSYGSASGIDSYAGMLAAILTSSLT